MKGGCAGVRHPSEDSLPVVKLPLICKSRKQEGTLLGRSVREFIVSEDRQKLI